MDFLTYSLLDTYLLRYFPTFDTSLISTSLLSTSLLRFCPYCTMYSTLLFSGMYFPSLDLSLSGNFLPWYFPTLVLFYFGPSLLFSTLVYFSTLILLYLMLPNVDISLHRFFTTLVYLYFCTSLLWYFSTLVLIYSGTFLLWYCTLALPVPFSCSTRQSQEFITYSTHHPYKSVNEEE